MFLLFSADGRVWQYSTNSEKKKGSRKRKEIMECPLDTWPHVSCRLYIDTMQIDWLHFPSVGPTVHGNWTNTEVYGQYMCAWSIFFGGHMAPEPFDFYTILSLIHLVATHFSPLMTGQLPWSEVCDSMCKCKLAASRLPLVTLNWFPWRRKEIFLLPPFTNIKVQVYTLYIRGQRQYIFK
jgi:hypothetical protein